MLRKRLNLYLIVFGILVLVILTSLSYFESKANQPVLSESSVLDFSDDAYTLLFAKDTNGPKDDGSQFEIHSVKSNGTSLTMVKTESSRVWQDSAFSHGIVESMGEYYGDFENPSRSKKLEIKSGWFAFFSNPKLYLVENNQRSFLISLNLNELEWLPDGKRVVFSDGDRIGIIDTESKQFGYLANGTGWIVVQ